MKWRMVDRILRFDRYKSITTVKTISFEEYQLKSAFGDQAHMPETLVLESLFQAAIWLIMLSSDFEEMGSLVRAQEVGFLEPVRPGQTLFVQVQARSYRRKGVLFDGQADVDGKAIAYGKGCLAHIMQVADYFVSDDLKVLFSEIHRPDNNCLA